MYEISYHPDVETDLKDLNLNLLKRIKKAIETRLKTHPEHYATPLRRDLKGHWKLRIGDFRVVFIIVKKKLIILGIMHRKKIYQKVSLRISTKLLK